MSSRRLLAILAVLGMVVLAGCTSGIGDTGTDGSLTTAAGDNPTTETALTADPAPAGELSA